MLCEHSRYPRGTETAKHTELGVENEVYMLDMEIARRDGYGCTILFDGTTAMGGYDPHG